MAEFKTGTAVTTATPTVVVDVTGAAPVPPGNHRFQLQVADESGNMSEPVFANVMVKDTQKPIAVLSAPHQVHPGQSFTLDGSKSSAAPPGRVVQWIWTMMS